ncbi:unnamed protein product [Lactuca virosa]|uniref:Uncharacterized protein n=1 Tax=Lactuca virosa TaxID=75947 RepID=A0AAU9M5T0_9ASTR|nr:unnamed protein product [Lactuca virosa]
MNLDRPKDLDQALTNFSKDICRFGSHLTREYNFSSLGTYRYVEKWMDIEKTIKMLEVDSHESYRAQVDKVLGFELLGILIWLKGCSWIARYLVSISTCSIASLNFYDLIAVGHTSPIRRSILVINFGLQESTLDFRVYKRSKQVSGRNGPLFTIKLWALFANKPLTTSPPYATIPHRSLLLFAGVGHDEEEEAGILSPRRKEHDSLDFDFCLISRFSRTHKW